MIKVKLVGTTHRLSILSYARLNLILSVLYQAANRALRSTGGTLAPERSLPRIAARSGTNCDVTNLSRSSRSPVSRPLGRWASLPIVISGGDNRRYHPLPICVSSYKRDGPLLKFLSAGFRPTVDRVSIPPAPAFRAPTPPSLVISSLSVAAIGTLPCPPRSPANMTFSSDTCLPFSETPDQPGDYSGDTR